MGLVARVKLHPEKGTMQRSEVRVQRKLRKKNSDNRKAQEGRKKK
jgi:hypothetical protein